MATARLEWTSVPRWTTPELPAAASYLACWFGDAAATLVRSLLADAGSDAGRPAGSDAGRPADPDGRPVAGRPVRLAGFPRHWDAAVESQLRGLIGDCRMGVRIIAAGPESLVLRVLAVARELGASDEELVLISTEATEAVGTAGPQDTAGPGYVCGVARRRVFCAPCRAAFDTVAAIGGTTVCPGCAAELVVDYRFSRPHAAYFGWPARLDLHR
jgi:hypothetical protein